MGAIILSPAETIAGKTSFSSTAEGNAFEVRLRYSENAMGAVRSGYDSWLAQGGAKTLALRMKVRGADALRLPRWLNTKDVRLGLEGVYTGLPSTASAERKGTSS
jgi:cystathionine gamma-lyase